jgi:hypothetical protein
MLRTYDYAMQNSKNADKAKEIDPNQRIFATFSAHGGAAGPRMSRSVNEQSNSPCKQFKPKFSNLSLDRAKYAIQNDVPVSMLNSQISTSPIDQVNRYRAKAGHNMTTSLARPQPISSDYFRNTQSLASLQKQRQ